MDIPEIRISLKCLFCKSDLMVEEGKDYMSGDMVECSECHELNDYDSLMEVAKEEGMEKMKVEVNKVLKNEFKDLFK